MSYLSVNSGRVVFHVSHESVRDFKHYLIESLDKILRSRSIEELVLDFGSSNFLCKKEVLRVREMVQTLEILNLTISFQNLSPRLSLALVRWGGDSWIKNGSLA